MNKQDQEQSPEQQDSGYTKEEVPFADGEGTKLEEAFEIPEKEDLEDSLPDQADEIEDESLGHA